MHGLPSKGKPNKVLQRTAGHRFFLLLGRPLPPPLSLAFGRQDRKRRRMFFGPDAARWWPCRWQQMQSALQRRVGS